MPNTVTANGSPLVSFTEAITLTSTTQLFSTPSDQQSLPQTSLIYVDPLLNRYLVLIDYMMNLQIHNITSYYMDTSSDTSGYWDPYNYVNPPLVQNLFKPKTGISLDLQCNNLV